MLLQKSLFLFTHWLPGTLRSLPGPLPSLSVMLVSLRHIRVLEALRPGAEALQVSEDEGKLLLPLDKECQK